MPSSEMQKRRTAGTPVPRPITGRGLFDNGSNCCLISAQIAQFLGLAMYKTGSSTTAGGQRFAPLYIVSLFIPDPADPTEYLAVADELLVMELDPILAEIHDVIVGRDVQQKQVMFLNGPRDEFCVAG